jgi:hypothetical protein
LIKKLKLLFLVCVLGCVAAAVKVATASPSAIIAIEPAEVLDVSAGETFKVNLTVTNVANLYGWQVNITFNPGVLNVASTDEGPFLKQVNETVVMKRVSNDGGFLLLSSSFTVPFPTQGATGSGLLATVTFTVTGQGASSLDFVKGTKLNTVPPPYQTVLPITDFTSVGGSFRNAAGGSELGIPLEWIVAIVIVIVAVGASVFFITRRRKGRSR